jgi:oligopeptide/dipeptide ABC transporter ATP-binding protein
LPKLLEVENLSVEIQGLPVIKAASFELFENETVALIGESGAGKTVLSQALTKLNPGNSVAGKVFFQGRDLFSRSAIKKNRGKIAYLFQDPFTGLNPLLKVRKQLWEKARISESEQLLWLKKLGLNPAYLSKYPHELSGGERQRLLMLMALALKPQLLIADEPTTFLDAEAQNRAVRLLKEQKQKTALSIFLITHNLHLAASLADRLIIMLGGSLVEEGAAKHLFKRPKHPYTKFLFDAFLTLQKPSAATVLANKPDFEAKTPNPGLCPFYRHCPKAFQPCFQNKPPIFTFSDGRVACFLYQTAQERP